MAESYLVGTLLDKTNLSGADVSGCTFEPRFSPRMEDFLELKGLETLTYEKNSGPLMQLRKLYRDSGMEQEERQVNYAINRRRTEILLHGSIWDRINGTFRLWFFGKTCAYGMRPGDPLCLILGLILLLTPFYFFALLSAKAGQIWAAPSQEAFRKTHKEWEPFRVCQNSNWLGQINTIFEESESLSTPKPPKPSSSIGRIIRCLKAVAFWTYRPFLVAFYFSLLSAFRLGFRQLDVGNWLARIQRRPYVLHGTGWVRTVAGIESLLSVYLLALWALSYFGRLFE